MVRLPYVTALTTLFSYGLLFAFGQLRDLARKILDARKPSNLKVCAAPAVLLRPGTLRILSRSLRLTLLFIPSQGYAPICLGLEDFYTRRLYLRIQVTCPSSAIDRTEAPL
jgi:serine palmitoyltransferase